MEQHSASLYSLEDVENSLQYDTKQEHTHTPPPFRFRKPPSDHSLLAFVLPSVKSPAQTLPLELASMQTYHIPCGTWLQIAEGLDVDGVDGLLCRKAVATGHRWSETNVLKGRSVTAV